MAATLPSGYPTDKTSYTVIKQHLYYVQSVLTNMFSYTTLCRELIEYHLKYGSNRNKAGYVVSQNESGSLPTTPGLDDLTDSCVFDAVGDAGTGGLHRMRVVAIISLADWFLRIDHGDEDNTYPIYGSSAASYATNFPTDLGYWSLITDTLATQVERINRIGSLIYQMEYYKNTGIFSNSELDNLGKALLFDYSNGDTDVAAAHQLRLDIISDLSNLSMSLEYVS